MKILGINAGIGASLCLLDGCKVVFAMEEERPTRIKGKGGLPLQCLDFVRERYPDFMKNLDHVAICDVTDGYAEREDLLERYDRRFEEDMATLVERLAVGARAKISGAVPESVKRALRPLPESVGLIELVRSHLEGIDLPDDKFVRLRHHDCHAASAYYGLAKDPERPYLILTLDGGGDAECATVSIGQRGCRSVPDPYNVVGLNSRCGRLGGRDLLRLQGVVSRI